MLFPIADDNKGISGPAYVTWLLLAINIVVFLLQLSDETITYGWSIIPQEIMSGQDLVEPQIVTDVAGEDHLIPQAPGPSIIYLTLLSHMFMHGGFGHIFGNMLYLWIFGDNIEHRFGHLRFFLFYIISGLVAAAAQLMVSYDGVIPVLGASGAIWGILGAYVVLFPRNKVKAIVLYMIVSIPALYVIGLWSALQIYQGFFAGGSELGGVAHLAHIGGLVAGLAMGIIAKSSLKDEPDSTIYREYVNDPRSKKRLW